MLIFEDHFLDNRNQWFTTSTERAEVGFETDACYSVAYKLPNFWVVWKTATAEPNFYARKEFHIQAALELTSAVEQSHYGLVWRVTDAGNLFEFTLAPDGRFQIAEYRQSQLKVHLPWQASTAIRPIEGINIVELRRANDQVSFYINSVCVAELPAATVLEAPGNSFGFVVHHQTRMRVHHLLISAAGTANRALSSGPPGTRAAYVEHEPPADDSLAQVKADIDSLIGHRRTKRELFSLASFLQVQTERKKREMPMAPLSLHLVLSGPPGTGKTTLSRLVGRLYKQLGLLERGHVIETDRAGVVGPWLGQTAIRMDDAVQQALEGVLFIDEAYTLAPRGAASNDYGPEALQVLVKRMEDYRERLAVIVAGYTDEMRHFLLANPGIQSRFTRMVQIEHYTPLELRLIFEKFCRDHGYTVEAAALARTEAIFRSACARHNKRFGNGRYARSLFERCIENQAIRAAPLLEGMEDAALACIQAADVPDELPTDLTERKGWQTASRII